MTEKTHSDSRVGEAISTEDIDASLADLQGMWSAMCQLVRTLPGAEPYIAPRMELPPIVGDIFEQAKAAERLESAQQVQGDIDGKARAWDSVWDLLTKLRPGFWAAPELNGQQAVLKTIEELATRSMVTPALPAANGVMLCNRHGGYGFVSDCVVCHPRQSERGGER